MGKILSGILGGFSGKVANVVGASWKGIDYMREYVIPSNPQSVAQTAHRAKFQAFVKLGRLILLSICIPFWNYKFTKMSGFNGFMQKNLLENTEVEPANVNYTITDGTLTGLVSASATYVAVSGDLTILFSGAIVGNGSTTDQVDVLVYSPNNNYVYYQANASPRNGSEINPTIMRDLSPADIKLFLFVHKATVLSDADVSESMFIQPTAG